MRKLSKKEQGILQNLMSDNELKGRLLLKRYVIRNTYEPKYKVGDFVKITDTSSSHICGVRVNNLNAVITEVLWILNTVEEDYEFIGYKCDVLDQDGKKHFAYVQEPIGKLCKPRAYIVGKSNTATNNFDTEKMKKGDYFYL